MCRSCSNESDPVGKCLLSSGVSTVCASKENNQVRVHIIGAGGILLRVQQTFRRFARTRRTTGRNISETRSSSFSTRAITVQHGDATKGPWPMGSHRRYNHGSSTSGC